jgi:hypothetical protein
VSRQGFEELLKPRSGANLAQITGTAEAALFPVSPFTAIPAYSVEPGQVFRLFASGVMTTPGATPGTLTVTPRWGTTTGGVSLGPSAASGALTVSKTNVPWVLDATLEFRAVNHSGAGLSAAVLGGRFQCDQVGVPALNFGGLTPTNLDTTTAQGLFIGMTLGAAGDLMTPQIVDFYAVN